MLVSALFARLGFPFFPFWISLFARLGFPYLLPNHPLKGFCLSCLQSKKKGFPHVFMSQNLMTKALRLVSSSAYQNTLTRLQPHLKRHSPTRELYMDPAKHPPLQMCTAQRSIVQHSSITAQQHNSIAAAPSSEMFYMVFPWFPHNPLNSFLAAQPPRPSTSSILILSLFF